MYKPGKVLIQMTNIAIVTAGILLGAINCFYHPPTYDWNTEWEIRSLNDSSLVDAPLRYLISTEIDRHLEEDYETANCVCWDTVHTGIIEAHCDGNGNLDKFPDTSSVYFKLFYNNNILIDTCLKWGSLDWDTKDTNLSKKTFYVNF